MSKKRSFFRVRREGFILVSALLIALVGSMIILALFKMTMAFSQTALLQRRDYSDAIALNSRIEEAKGFIVNWNNTRAIDGETPLLRGGRYGGPQEGQQILALSDLQLSSGDEVADVLSRDETVTLGGVKRRLVLQAYDANYAPEHIPHLLVKNAANAGQTVPPCLRQSPRQGGGEMVDETDPNHKPFFAETNRFGAYVVVARLYIYNPSASATARPIREVQTAFSQVVPKKPENPTP